MWLRKQTSLSARAKNRACKFPRLHCKSVILKYVYVTASYNSRTNYSTSCCFNRMFFTSRNLHIWKRDTSSRSVSEELFWNKCVGKFDLKMKECWSLSKRSPFLSISFLYQVLAFLTCLIKWRSFYKKTETREFKPNGRYFEWLIKAVSYFAIKCTYLENRRNLRGL